MTTPRVIGAIVLVLGLAGLGGSIPAMAGRLSHRDVKPVWFQDSIGEPIFEFLRHPVEIRTVDPPPGQPDARPRLEIDWRGETRSFEIEPGTREDPRLPGLLRHEDWLRVLVMAEDARSKADLERGIADGTILPRLIVATRLPAKDYEPGSWGSVRRKEWRYRFIELLTPEASPDRAFEVVEGTYGEFDRLGDPVFRREAGREREAWKYSVMQHVTPPTLVRAKSRPVEDAMRALGWTWPVAGVSMMGLTAGLVLLALPGASRGE